VEVGHSRKTEIKAKWLYLQNCLYFFSGNKPCPCNDDIFRSHQYMVWRLDIQGKLKLKQNDYTCKTVYIFSLEIILVRVMMTFLDLVNIWREHKMSVLLDKTFTSPMVIFLGPVFILVWYLVWVLPKIWYLNTNKQSFEECIKEWSSDFSQIVFFLFIFYFFYTKYVLKSRFPISINYSKTIYLKKYLLHYIFVLW